MTNHLFLGIKLEPGPIHRAKLDNIDFENKVKSFRNEVSKECRETPEHLQLIYHGRMLDDEKCLRDYGMKTGEMVHVLKKSDIEIIYNVPKSPIPAGQFIALYRTLGIPSTQNSFAHAMAFLSQQEELEKIVAEIPKLADDPVAISYLTEPELLFRLLDPKNYDSIASKHPTLILAVIKIMHKLYSGKQALDDNAMFHLAESDDDNDGDISADADDDGAGSDDGQSTSGGGVTTEQLAVALELAGVPLSTNFTANQGTPSTSTNLRSFSGISDGPSQSTAASSRMRITRDMFNSALSQAFTATSETSSTTEPTPALTVPSLDLPAELTEDLSSARSYLPQLLSMREIGLSDHRINLRALIISGGDVNAAINLVFSGVIED